MSVVLLKDVELVLMWNKHSPIACQSCGRPVFKRDNWVMWHKPASSSFLCFLCLDCFKEYQGDALLPA